METADPGVFQLVELGSTSASTFQSSFISFFVVGVSASETPGEYTFPVQYDQLELLAGTYVFLESISSSTLEPSCFSPTRRTPSSDPFSMKTETFPSTYVTSMDVSPFGMPSMMTFWESPVPSIVTFNPSGPFTDPISAPNFDASRVASYPTAASFPPGIGVEGSSPPPINATAPIPATAITATRTMAMILVLIHNPPLPASTSLQACGCSRLGFHPDVADLYGTAKPHHEYIQQSGKMAYPG